jgi:oligopeptidase A
LRREKARLLGFADFADLVLEDRMAHNGARALHFLEDLKRKTERRFREENRELLEFRRSSRARKRRNSSPGTWLTTPKSSAPRSTISTRRRCGPTFRWRSVVAGMFDLVHRLYGIAVTEEKGVPTWDPQVCYYNVHDENGASSAGSTPTGIRAKTSAAARGWTRFITGGPAEAASSRTSG